MPIDVAYFESRVLHWLERLSLGDWSVEVYKDDTGTDMARCEMWHNTHGAHIKLNVRFEYKLERAWLDKLALHEVCHILLCDLKRLFTEHDVADWQKETAEHAIIRRLERALTGESNVK